MPDVVKALACFIGCKTEKLYRALYFGYAVVTNPGFTPLRRGKLLSQKELADNRERYKNDFAAVSGYDGLREIARLVAVDAADRIVYADGPWGCADPMGMAEALEIHPRLLNRLLDPAGRVDTSGRFLEETDAGTYPVFPVRNLLRDRLLSLVDKLQAADDGLCGRKDGTDRYP